jgi:hypothetical protein
VPYFEERASRGGPPKKIKKSLNKNISGIFIRAMD